MKRLLAICHGFPPYYGGAENAAFYLSREAVRASGCEVTVLTSDIGGRLPPAQVMDGIRVIRVPARKRDWTHHTAPELASFLFSARRALPRIVSEFKPDHVFAHFSFPAGELARQTGIPYTVILQGSDVPGYQPKRFALLYPFLKPIVRRVWRSAAHVVAVSDRLRELALKTWPGGRIEVIENGVDTDLFHPPEKRAEDGVSGVLDLVVVAQLIERKGIQHLLYAVASLASDIQSRICLHLHGTGPYEPVLAELAERLGLKERVRFHGLTPHERLPDILRAADLFILPSLEEGLPLALLEAMSTGAACIATKVGGIPRALRDRVDSLLVAPADPVPLRVAVDTLVRDAALRARIGAAASETASAYAWHKLWARHADLIARA